MGKERERESGVAATVFEYCLDLGTGRQFARLIRRPASASASASASVKLGSLGLALSLWLQPVGAINALNAAAWCGIVN